MAGQAIRPSQFVFTFGVGSVIEAPGGPRIIKQFSDWGRVFGSGRDESVSNFVIHDSIASALLDNGAIFRVPTNVELNEPDNETVFQTGYFPNWALCIRHGYLYELQHGDRTRCTGCVSEGDVHPGRREAIRFVRACEDGHLDDIDWYGIVHDFTKECGNSVFRWNSRGGSLRNVTITCESCGSHATLSDIYNRTRYCTGRYPETGKSFSSCSKKAEVTLRGSSSLRIPEIITTITLPRFASRLHRIFDDIQMRTILSLKDEWTKEELLSALEKIGTSDPTLMDPAVIDEIQNAESIRFSEVVKDIKEFGTKRPTKIEEVRLEEFRSMQEAASLGFPPDPTSENPEFQVNKLHVRDNVSFGKYKLRVAPIDRLRVVNVQKGYRRLGTESKNRVVPTFYYDGKRKWFPGIEQIGEGIFIDAGGNSLGLESNEWDEQYVSSGNQLEYSPTFVWWHSLSHRIITALSIDSGYSSAAIRECVYTVKNEKTNSLTGGILLYTVQSGGDGTLGGLISLVPQFETVLDAAMRNVHFCSNDPLCSEDVIRTGKHSGASCYACMLLSETSCSHRNMHLDRNLLRWNFE